MGLQQVDEIRLKIHQKGLALMGFSRYCPSSLDLTNFVVRSCRGAAAEPCPGYLWLTALNLGIQESGNLESKKEPKMKILRIQIRSAQNVGKVLLSRKQNLLAPFGTISGQFSHRQKKCKQF